MFFKNKEYMYLKFIGEDGSMGLRNGINYKVKITSDDAFIWVHWNGGECPYLSPQSFAANWKRWDG